MRCYFKLLNFLAFPFRSIPHPPLTWLPLSQNGRGFSEVTVLMIWHWVRAIKAARKGPSPSGRRWPIGRMRGYCKLLIFLAFSIHKIPSPTTDVVPPLPKRARVFRYRSDSTPTNMTRVFRFFPKQRRLQLGSNFSASQSALGSPTVNFPDAKPLF